MALQEPHSRGLRPLGLCALTLPSNSRNLESLFGQIVDAVGRVTGQQTSGLHEPVFGENEKKYVIECLETGFVSSVGSFVGKFEQELARFVGASDAVAVVNGTSGLHLALTAVGVRPGDEVIVPALSFVATASAVRLAGATPHFVDVSHETWGMDGALVGDYLRRILQRDGQRWINSSTGQPVTAIVPMHTLGQPCDMNLVSKAAKDFGLAVVEDAAESLGSFAGAQHTGISGRAGVFSFNGNKTITTGGGGAIVTNDNELASRLRHLSTTAKIPHPFEFDHDEVGYNYRMPNINAALGLAQLEQLPELVRRQRALHHKYSEIVAPIPIASLRTDARGTTSNYWLHALLLAEEFATERDLLITGFLDAGIPVRPLWKPLNTLKPYRNFPSAPTPNAEDLYSRVICLPSSASLVSKEN